MTKTTTDADFSDLPPTLRAERHGAVAVLKLARPEKRNALDDGTVAGIEAFFTTLFRRTKPDATVHVVFIGEANYAQERAAASALIDRGADVLGQSIDGQTPQIVAQERGVFATGHAVDLHELAPKSALCASTWVWDRYGTTPLVAMLADADGASSVLDFYFVDGSDWNVTTKVAAVLDPTLLPATLPLFASGLGVLGLITRRRKRKVAAVAG